MLSFISIVLYWCFYTDLILFYPLVFSGNQISCLLQKSKNPLLKIKSLPKDGHLQWPCGRGPGACPKRNLFKGTGKNERAPKMLKMASIEIGLENIWAEWHPYYEAPPVVTPDSRIHAQFFREFTNLRTIFRWFTFTLKKKLKFHVYAAWNLINAKQISYSVFFIVFNEN